MSDNNFVAIQIVPDRYKQVTDRYGDRAKTGFPGLKHVRRPTRGIVLKKDTYATLSVLSGNGDHVHIIDAGSQRPPRKGSSDTADFTTTDLYSNFLLQQVQEERMEKQQVLETFGEAYIFLFGERPRTMTFSGVLLNTFDFNWEAEWWENYDKYLRGTKCVENDARVYMSFDETLVSGYILGAQATKTSQERNFITLQFQMFITSYATLSRLGNPKAYISKANFDPEQFGPVTNTAVFRPTLIPTTQGTPWLRGNQPLPINVSGLLDIKKFSLVDGLLLGTNAVRGAYGYATSLAGSVAGGATGAAVGSEASASGVPPQETATQVADKSVYSTSNAILRSGSLSILNNSDLALRLGDNGSLVRVPVGFAGVTAFDDDGVRTQLRSISGSGTVKYSTFSDNVDEYIGDSDHYGSSITESGVFAVKLGPSTEETLGMARRDIDRVRAQWESAGYRIGPQYYAKIDKSLQDPTNQTGLSPIGAAQKWALNEGPEVADLAIETVLTEGQEALSGKTNANAHGEKSAFGEALLNSIGNRALRTSPISIV